jgi:hypothetical protein
MSESLRKMIFDGHMPPLLTRWEAERALGVNPRQMDLLVENGVFTRSPIGHGMVRTSEVRAFLERRR